MTTGIVTYQPRQRRAASGRKLPTPLPEFVQRYLENGVAAASGPYTGVTTDGTVVPGLFPTQPTGVSTLPIKDAAEALLAALGPDRGAAATFPIDSDEWRKWSNIHVYVMRHGASMEEMSAAQREAAFGLLSASLSPRGFELARDIMRLNETIGEITGSWDEYGEWLYWLSVFGAPSADQPWGWQIDGHHLIVNTFVLGDQIVMTPLFMGSEPTAATNGKYAGTRVFEAEERVGLALIRSLSEEQRAKAILPAEHPAEVFTTAFRDNFELRYEGIAGSELVEAQQAVLLDLIECYIGRTRSDHADVKMAEVKQHLADTHFAWIGSTDDDSVFYYRVHSPVLLIEFDHESGIALDNDVPTRNHIHTVVRTPNGNDYGKDLLRQHYERFDHSRPGSH